MDVQLVLLKALAGMGARPQEQPLREGAVLPGRVLKGGAIMLAGVRLAATLRYESAGLGRVDLALTLEGGAVRAVAHVPAGEVAQRLRAASGDLRAALTGALGRPATVDVVAHAEVLDVSA